MRQLQVGEINKGTEAEMTELTETEMNEVTEEYKTE